MDLARPAARTAGVTIEQHPADARWVDDVRQLIQQAVLHDAVSPVSEATTLDLDAARTPRTPRTHSQARHLLAYATPRSGRRGPLVGYAHLDPTAPRWVAELVVHPDHRRQGVGRTLLDAVVRECATTGGADVPRELLAWAHGHHAGARALAGSAGFAAVRELRQMRRTLSDALAPPALPPGIRLRAFRPGEDDARWLRLNARAFADHPEQGRWTLDDLHQRMAEPWFDPPGFLVAEPVPDDGGAPAELLGAHWTKIHPAQPGGGGGGGGGSGGGSVPDAAQPVGEVYVLAVDPAAGSGGLGKALVVAGLRHLREQGLGQVMLYVDADNVSALRLYEALGFRRALTDVQYRYTRPLPPALPEPAGPTSPARP